MNESIWRELRELRAIGLVEADVAAGTVATDDDPETVDPWRFRAGDQQLGLHRTQRRIAVERRLSSGSSQPGIDLDVVVEERDRGRPEFDRSVEAGVGAASEPQVAGRSDNVDITVSDCTTTIVDQDHEVRITPHEGRC